jgi:hypothetical protein
VSEERDPENNAYKKLDAPRQAKMSDTLMSRYFNPEEMPKTAQEKWSKELGREKYAQDEMIGGQ